MSDRRDFDDIKLIGGGLDIKDSDLRDLDVDLLAGPDLNADLLGDDFEEPMPRGRKRKSGSSSGKLGLLLGVLVLGGGGAFAYLNKDALMPLIMGNTPRVAKAPVTSVTPPTDTAATTPTPATPDAAMPDIAGDLPQPDSIPNATPGDTATAPVPGDATAAVTPAPTPATPIVPADPTATTAPVVPVPDVAAAIPAPGASGTPAPVAAPNDLPLPDATAAVTPTPAPAPDTAIVPAVPNAKAPADTALQPVPDVAKDAAKPAETKTADAKATKSNKADKTTAATKTDNKKDVAAAAPEGKAIDAGDLGDIKMPELPDVENAMKGKGDYIESTTALQDMSDASAPRMNLTAEQKSQGLGVSVDDQEKPAAAPKDKAPAKTAAPTATVATTAATAGAVSGATAATVPDVEAKIAAADRALDLERFQAAYDMFNDLYKMNPRDERILMGRAVSLQKLGRNDEAVRAYDELLAMNPDNPEVMINALALVRNSNPTEALSRLLTLRQKYPTNATIAAQIGLVNAELKNYDEGIRYLNIAADLESTNPKHFFNMAVIAERMGRPDMAIGYYERALKADALSANSGNKLNRDVVYDRLSYLRQQSGAATPAAQ